MLAVRLLGPINIHCSGVSLASAGRDKGLLLFAYLAATAGRKHARNDLADLFWPGMERQRALHNLRQTLLRLRGLLPAAMYMPAYLEADAYTIAFNQDADYWLDLEPFLLPCHDMTLEMLEQRAALYRGPFMSDWTCGIGERFVAWVEEWRNACHRNVFMLEELLSARHEADGRPERALEHARQCVELEPWQESSHRRLMRLLACVGQAGVALRHFRALRKEIYRELGSDVEAETLSLAKQIQREEAPPIQIASSVGGSRVQVAVLDCGLSYGRQYRRDPQVLAALLAPACRLAREIINIGGGRLISHRPNGLSALFGWPRGNGHAASNMARGVLRLQADIARAHPDVRVTVGAESGTLVESEGQDGAWYVLEQAMHLRLTAPAGIAVIGARLQQDLNGSFGMHSLPAMRGRPDAWRLSIELGPMQATPPGNRTPASLQDLLATRLKQEGDAKALLQVAAVIGHEFSVAHLRCLIKGLGGAMQPLAGTLVGLVETKLLECESVDRARFSHAVLQRLAYDSLSPERRIELHQRYAGILQSQPTAAAAAATIAWHLSAGGLAADAAYWWLRAARQASGRSAYTEAAQLAERVLAALSMDNGNSGEREDTELEALLLVAYARVALGGYFDGAAQVLYGRVRALLRGRDVNARQTLDYLRGHWFGASSRASYKEARAIAEEFIAVADRAGLQGCRGIGCYLAGNSMLWLGEFESALRILEEAVAILDRDPVDTGFLVAHDQDFKATATGYLGWAHWFLGRPTSALTLARRAINLARQSGHLLTLLHTTMTFCSIGADKGGDMVKEVGLAAKEMLCQARSRKLRMWTDMGRLLRHWSLAQQGRKSSTSRAVRALDRLCRVYPGGAAGFQAIFAAACLARGEHVMMANVLAALELSLQVTEAYIFTATRYLLSGQLALRQHRPRVAAAEFRRAIQTATAQGSPMLEMQAWAALCELRSSPVNQAGLASAASRCAEPGMDAIIINSSEEM